MIATTDSKITDQRDSPRRIQRNKQVTVITPTDAASASLEIVEMLSVAVHPMAIVKPTIDACVRPMPHRINSRNIAQAAMLCTTTCAAGTNFKPKVNLKNNNQIGYPGVRIDSPIPVSDPNGNSK